MLEDYQKIQPEVQKEIQTQLEKFFAQKQKDQQFEISKIQNHVHSGTDSPKIPMSSITSFIPVSEAEEGSAFNYAISIGQGVNVNETFETPGLLPIPLITGGGLISVGDSTTQFDVTNPAGTTFRYTYDGTGTDPNISTYTFIVGNTVTITGTNLNVGNRGTFTITGSGDNYFEVTNAGGVVESNKTIGSGSIETDSFFKGGDAPNGTLVAFQNTDNLTTSLWVKIDSFWFGVVLPNTAPGVI